MPRFLIAEMFIRYIEQLPKSLDGDAVPIEL
jgi:hypothetical protein